MHSDSTPSGPRKILNLEMSVFVISDNLLMFDCMFPFFFFFFFPREKNSMYIGLTHPSLGQFRRAICDVSPKL